MTEAEWLGCMDPGPMLELQKGKASDRKLRWFAAACFRHIEHLLSDNRQQRGIELLERMADNTITQQEMRRVARDVRSSFSEYPFFDNPIMQA